MKELNELTERMDGADELIDSLVKKITELDKRETKITDYTPHFEALKQIFEVFLLKYNKESEALNTVVAQLNISYPAEQIKNTIAESKGILEAIRKALPVRVKHQFNFKTKGWIIAGMILLIVTAISTGLCSHLWAENSRMQANDIKFRAIRQVYPIQAYWADKYYAEHPDAMKDTTERLESEATERSEYLDLSNQKSRETKITNKKIYKIKRH